MRRKIFIQIPRDFFVNPEIEPHVGWVVQEAGQVPGPVYYGDLATAANHATGCKVVVVVSGYDVLLADVDLPVMNKQRLTKAIPYALEELVISDLEEVHFAVGPRLSNARVACAVVERSLLEIWLQRFKQAGLHPDVICSDAGLVQRQEDSWCLLANSNLLAQHSILLRFDEQRAMALDLENLLILLASVYDSSGEADRPKRLNLVLSEDQLQRQNLISFDDAESILDNDNEPTINQAACADDVHAVAEELLQELKTFCNKHEIEFEYTPSEQSYLAIMAQNYNESSCINLLQGEYSRSEQLGKLFRPWRAAAATLAAWLLLQGGVFVSDYQQLAKQNRELRQQIGEVFRTAFPEVKTIVDPKLQMERGLKQLQQGGGNQVSLFSLLAQSGKILSESQSVTLTSIRYTGGKLDVDLQITDLESLDALKERLTKEANLSVDIVSASARDNKVESRLQLKQSS